jgi:transcription termination factor NusG
VEESLSSGDGEAAQEFYEEIDRIARVRTAIAPQWFAVYTASDREKRILNQLVYRNLEPYLPLYKASRQWRKRPSLTLNLPLFPHYVFVEFRGISAQTFSQSPCFSTER